MKPEYIEEIELTVEEMEEVVAPGMLGVGGVNHNETLVSDAE